MSNSPSSNIFCYHWYNFYLLASRLYDGNVFYLFYACEPHSSTTAANLNILDVDIAAVYFQFVIVQKPQF